MAIVYQTNKKTGVRYAYESVSYWDKERKQSRAKRTCIGRVDQETGEIIPTRKKVVAERNIKPGPARSPGLPAFFMGPPTSSTASGSRRV
jgi:hypothetical protein